MLQRTGEAETITTHYLFALGLYRALYIPNWLYRYFAEGYVDQIPWVAGMVQTILYSDFFWIYYTKSVPSVCAVVIVARPSRCESIANMRNIGCCRVKSSISQFERLGVNWRRMLFALAIEAYILIVLIHQENWNGIQAVSVVYQAWTNNQENLQSLDSSCVSIDWSAFAPSG